MRSKQEHLLTGIRMKVAILTFLSPYIFFFTTHKSSRLPRGRVHENINFIKKIGNSGVFRFSVDISPMSDFDLSFLTLKYEVSLYFPADGYTS